MNLKKSSLGTDKPVDIGSGKEVLGSFVAKMHAPDGNSHEIWSNEPQNIISLALIRKTLELEKKSLVFS